MIDYSFSGKSAETEEERAPQGWGRPLARSLEDERMQAKLQGMAALALLAWAGHGRAQELIFRPAAPRAAAPGRAPISLGQPEPLRQVSFVSETVMNPGYTPLTP